LNFLHVTNPWQHNDLDGPSGKSISFIVMDGWIEAKTAGKK
jgi:hypothetical protein